MTEPECNVSIETATEEYLKNLNPLIWEKISSLSPQEQDEYWFKLTQSHLNSYKEGGELDNEDNFIDEELELLLLNYFTSKRTPPLDINLPQRGGVINREGRVSKFQSFGDFLESIAEEQGQKSTSLLIGGVGIVGKATVRTVLTQNLIERFPEKKVLSIDRDYQKRFPFPWEGDINIVEDVHGLDIGEGGELFRFDGNYDLLVYVLPTPKSQKQILLNRGVGWFKRGKVDLTDPGRKTPETEAELLEEVSQELERMQGANKEWYKEQLNVLRKLREQGVKIVIVDPTEIFKVLYNFKEGENLTGSFRNLLRENIKSTEGKK